MYYYTIIKLIVTKKKEKLNDTMVLKYLSTNKVNWVTYLPCSLDIKFSSKATDCLA